MMKILMSAVLLLGTWEEVRGQCITSNDVGINETSIGTAVRNLIDGSMAFSLNLLRTITSDQMTKAEPNGMFFSPYSVWAALVVTYMGARGATEVEMKNVLGIGDVEKVTAWEAFRNIRDPNKQSTQPTNSFQSANRIYFQQGATFKDCMQEILQDNIGFVDFIGQPDEARTQINTWIEQQTQDKIKGLIPPNAISPLTNMIITNAVYFKENWLEQFDPSKTRRGRFTTSSRRDIFVNMMNVRGRYLYGKSEELQCYALELPYTGNELSMIFLLPNNRFTGVKILSNSLTPDRLKDLINDMYPREVMVSIPKFKLEDTFDLSSVLYNMGLRTLFDAGRVDLSGFTGYREFAVSSVLHKTYIDVNEEGTEAAAATSIITSRSARPIGPASFVAEYPFIFLIRDNLSNVILFIGTVEKPPEFQSNSN